MYEYTLLDRLAIVGSSGMGALTYEPQLEMTIDSKTDDLDEPVPENFKYRVFRKT